VVGLVLEKLSHSIFEEQEADESILFASLEKEEKREYTGRHII